ncbi:MAG TPA: NUDIX hydrolase [Clostridia bacterium]|nr:NUDIX hydrolase [Clostridia bacterium]
MEEKTLQSTRIYEGKILNLRVDEVSCSSGKRARREIVEHRGAVAVIPFNNQGEILLVQQFRKPVEEYLWEIPAGKLEAGENPRQCATRELLEETGLKAKKLEFLAKFFTSPGFSNEVVHLYLTLVQGEKVQPRDQEEITGTKWVSLEKAWEMIRSGSLVDGKTLLAISYILSLPSLPGSSREGFISGDQ